MNGVPNLRLQSVWSYVYQLLTLVNKDVERYRKVSK